MSIEHSGFTFTNDMLAASHLIKKHSGGVCSEAILMAMKVRDVEGRNVEFSVVGTGEVGVGGRGGDGGAEGEVSEERSDGCSNCSLARLLVFATKLRCFARTPKISA